MGLQRSHSLNRDGFISQLCYFDYAMILVHLWYEKGQQIPWLNNRAHPTDGCDPSWQISTMSSSEIEEASMGVPSLLVMITRHNLLLKTMSVDGTSQSPEAVVEEVTDIFFF